jgi:hypothetical protein
MLLPEKYKNEICFVVFCALILVFVLGEFAEAFGRYLNA